MRGARLSSRNASRCGATTHRGGEERVYARPRYVAYARVNVTIPREANDPPQGYQSPRLLFISNAVAVFLIVDPIARPGGGCNTARVGGTGGEEETVRQVALSAGPRLLFRLGISGVESLLNDATLSRLHSSICIFPPFPTLFSVGFFRLFVSPVFFVSFCVRLSLFVGKGAREIMFPRGRALSSMECAGVETVRTTMYRG